MAARRPLTHAVTGYLRETAINRARVGSGTWASSAWRTIGASVPSTSNSTAARAGSARIGSRACSSDVAVDTGPSMPRLAGTVGPRTMCPGSSGLRSILAGVSRREPAAAAIVRVVLIVVAIVITLYVIWLLRKPLSWIFIAGFLAIALTGPVNLFSRFMPRKLAIVSTYLGLILIPALLLAIIVPPIVREGTDLA